MPRLSLRVAATAAVVAVASGDLLRVPLRKVAPNVAGHLATSSSPAPLLGASVDAAGHAVTLSNFMDAQVRRVRVPRLPCYPEESASTQSTTDAAAGPCRASRLWASHGCMSVLPPAPP